MNKRKTGGDRAPARGAPLYKPEPAPGTITAYPRAADEHVGAAAASESGLSVDADELGAQFLSNATEQSLSESYAPDAALEGVGEEDWGADTLGASFEEDPEGWERSMSRVLQSGTVPLASRPPGRTRARRVPASEHEEEPGSEDVDVTEDVMHEASLLDHEGRELGEVESPSLRTDDTHTHGKRRGGHAPHKRRPA